MPPLCCTACHASPRLKTWRPSSTSFPSLTTQLVPQARCHVRRRSSSLLLKDGSLHSRSSSHPIHLLTWKSQQTFWPRSQHSWDLKSAVGPWGRQVGPRTMTPRMLVVPAPPGLFPRQLLTPPFSSLRTLSRALSGASERLGRQYPLSQVDCLLPFPL